MQVNVGIMLVLVLPVSTSSVVSMKVLLRAVFTAVFRRFPATPRSNDDMPNG